MVTTCCRKDTNMTARVKVTEERTTMETKTQKMNNNVISKKKKKADERARMETNRGMSTTQRWTRSDRMFRTSTMRSHAHVSTPTRSVSDDRGRTLLLPPVGFFPTLLCEVILVRARAGGGRVKIFYAFCHRKKYGGGIQYEVHFVFQGIYEEL